MINSEDLSSITRQLGREPVGIEAISTRCTSGFPQVIVCRPLVQRIPGRPEPFPTTYWLSCPMLVHEVSRLEGEGMMEMFRQIEDDETRRVMLKAAHEYSKARAALLSRAELDRLREESPGMARVICDSGIGGSANPMTVKCLHSHVAHYLAGGTNPIGEQAIICLRNRGVRISGQGCVNALCTGT